MSALGKCHSLLSHPCPRDAVVKIDIDNDALHADVPPVMAMCATCVLAAWRDGSIQTIDVAVHADALGVSICDACDEPYDPEDTDHNDGAESTCCSARCEAERQAVAAAAEARAS